MTHDHPITFRARGENQPGTGDPVRRQMTVLLLALLPLMQVNAAAADAGGVEAVWQAGRAAPALSQPGPDRGAGAEAGRHHAVVQARIDQARADLNALLKARAGKADKVTDGRRERRVAVLLAVLERLRADELAEKGAVLTLGQRKKLKALRTERQ